MVGRKNIYFGVLAETLFGKMLCSDDISPKRDKYRLEALDACHKGTYREHINPYLLRGGKVVSERETKQEFLFGNEEWCGKYPLSRGNGRATNMLVDSLGQMPIRNQKWLVQPKGQKGEIL